MYLKSLTLKGFKSFPDRTRMEFGPGVSVIVGPNGSGKSNVTDAVLWVLGEQSPLAVRGQSMQDIIFSGTVGRRAAPGAEVELVLDDSEGQLGLGSPEVSVVRRLDRNGEGEYRLAGARCRLVDVMELLSDTGLGKEMHSVISQGRVEAIVTSKPRDRRMLIEEAAGLGKHRKRRRRAQLKLTRTQENLDRALDIEREARTRLRPLKRQAEAAEQHARLARQLLEARWELGRDDLRTRLAAVGQAERVAESARAQRAAREAELVAVAKRREAAEEALAGRTAEREELSRRCYVAQSAHERVGYRAEAVRAAERTVRGRLVRARTQIDALAGEQAADVLDPEAGARVAALETLLAALDRDREAELARQLAELEAGREQAQAAVAVREQARAEAGVSRVEAERALEGARLAVREAERSVEARRREAARVGGELAGVNQFLRSHAELPGGAVALADGLRVEPGLELALAAALDGRLRAAVVADRGQAAALLDRLGGDGAIALVGGGDAPSPAGAPPVAGAVRLADCLRGDEPAVVLAQRLLADTWVVDDVNELPEDFPGVAVTRAGRVWSARAGELRQAARAGGERVLEERNRRERLLRESEAAAGAETTARRELEAASARVGELERACHGAVDADRAAVRGRDEAIEAERRLKAQIDRRRSAPDEGPAAAQRAQVQAELNHERATLERAERERAARHGRLAQLRAGVVGDEALEPVLGEVLRALAAAGEAIAAQAARFAAALDADRQAAAHVSGELKACATEEATLQGGLHRDNEAVTAAEVALQRARDQLADAQTLVAGMAAELGLAAEPAAEALEDEQRSALLGRIDRLQRRRDQLGPVNPLAQDEFAEALAHVEELERQRTDMETALRELRDLIRDTDRQIERNFSETFTAAARNFEELAAQLFPGGRGRLRLVDDRDGAPARVLGASGEAGEAEEEAETETAAPEDMLGVEIEITPAGKEMKRLTLLSGGEKSMTALAFLFSVFLARPCPFYILDEVEAALDDLNIDRFLALLNRYSERAQFIVVTHQKRTMEVADSLYGVSMGGDGISKVISRRLPPRREASSGDAPASVGAAA